VNVSVELQGADRLARLLGRIENTAQEGALDQAMYNAGTTVLNESKKIVPVDTGALKNSGRVEPVKRTKDSIEVEITYGGAAAGYALYVHEDPAARHKPGQTFKFLEIPVMAYQDKFIKSVMARYASYLRRLT
jgi:hypothetical protein